MAINQAAKRILKALSFDGVEVEAFRHMADLKRLDPMKIFYKKIDEKIYNGSHEVPVRIFFPNEKSFQESEDKQHDSKDKKLLLFIHGGGWVTESIDNYERICARLADATGQYVVAVEYRLAPEDKFPSGLEDCYAVAKALYRGEFVLNVKPENITLIGDSAGGNLCAALSLMARDRTICLKVIFKECNQHSWWCNYCIIQCMCKIFASIISFYTNSKSSSLCIAKV